jgi:hypothetical protein
LLGAVPFHPRQLDVIDLVESHPQAFVAAGRRSGKSRIAAAVAVHSLLLSDRLDGFMTPHEPRFAVVVANSEDQAQIVRGLAVSLVKSSPKLRRRLVGESATTLVFQGNRILKVLPCNSRTIRGLPASCVVLDEMGHYLSETEGPAVARRIWEALTPAVGQFQGEGRVLCVSTPGDAGGLFEELFLKADAGEMSGAVAFSASTLEMNPGMTAEFLEAQRAALGPDGFAREYEARFVAGGGAFFDPDDLRDVTGRRREALPQDGRDWVCALDPSSGGDPYGLVVVGRDVRRGYEGRLLVGQVARWTESKRGRRMLSRRTRQERDSWSDGVHDQVAEIALRFRARVVSDQHVPGVTVDELRQRGVGHVTVRAWTAQEKTNAFQALRARVATGRIELAANDDLHRELLSVRNRFRGDQAAKVEVPRTSRGHGDLALALAAGVALLDQQGVGGDRYYPQLDGERRDGSHRAIVDVYGRVF